MNKHTAGDKGFLLICYILLGFALLITLYPMIYILSCSFSNPQAVIAGKVWLYPVRFSVLGYETIFKNRDIMTGYGNSIFYTVIGTVLSVVLTMLAAYPLSRSDYKLGGIAMKLMTFTMFFGGGMIPTYLLVNSLGLNNTRAAMILPGAVGVYNVIITRTFIRSNIPADLHESAQLDGCSDFTFLRAIVVPLSKAVIAVIALYYMIGYWNSFFNALLYLSDRSKYPLQLILREILIQNQMTAVDNVSQGMSPDEIAARQARYELLKYSLIVVASVPLLCIYPAVQKHFVKGVMIGAIKG